MTGRNGSVVARYRDRVPIVAGHRVTLADDEWDDVRGAVEAGDDVYVAAVVSDESRVPFVQNRWSDGWVLPGGAVAPGESLATAAEREVAEETGLEATIQRPVACVEQTFTRPPGRSESAPETVTGHLVVFAATARTTTLTASPGVTEDEIGAVRWFGRLPDRVDGVPPDLLERLLEVAT